MSNGDAIVVVIDDDPFIRADLDSLARSTGLRVKTFASAGEFQAAKLPDAPACMLLDVRLPNLSGLDLQNELSMMGLQIPIIFISYHVDIPTSIRAMKAGAFDFLTRPFQTRALLESIEQALAHDRASRLKKRELAELHAFFESLTPRQRDVMRLVVSGLLNKQVAATLGISEITVKLHRGHIMRKMCARSFADLVRMSEKLGIGTHPETDPNGQPQA